MRCILQGTTDDHKTAELEVKEIDAEPNSLIVELKVGPAKKATVMKFDKRELFTAVISNAKDIIPQGQGPMP